MIRVKPKRAKPKPKVDIYEGVHPELAEIGRLQNARPLDMDRERAPFLLKDEAWAGFDEFLREFRHSVDDRGELRK